MLNTSRVILSPVREQDLPLLHAWINDRSLVLFSAPYHPVDEFDHRAWFESLQGRSDVVLFGIRLVESDELIGTCQLCNIHPVHRNSELRIRIGKREAQGLGYGGEALGLLLRHAFCDLNLERVYLWVFASNDRAIRLYESAGFKREGVLRNAAHIDGRYVNLIAMGVLRKEFAVDA